MVWDQKVARSNRAAPTSNRPLSGSRRIADPRRAMTNPRRFAAEYLHVLTTRIFAAAGTPPHIADVVAGILVSANLTGHDSHGVLRIPAYVRAIDAGDLVPAAVPQVVKETHGTLTIDGGRGFGHYTAREAMRWAIEKARAVDICCVSLVHAGHIGRLGEYAEQAARSGCIGMVTSGRAGPGVQPTAPYGGAAAALGTNPIAVGVPAGDGAPFILDYATSRIAVGKIHDARSRGAILPEGSLVDQAGSPSVRPQDFYDGGFLLPFGGHKGYALGVLVSLLGGLSGTFDAASGTMGGGFMLVIDVAALVSLEEYQRGARALLSVLRATPPASGFAEVLAPGDPEHRARVDREANGIEVPEEIVRQISECAHRLGVSMQEESEGTHVH